MPDGVRVETLAHPDRYSLDQLEHAVWVARILSRGRFVLCEPPRG